MLEVEQATFTPLVFSTAGGMAVECNRYRSRLTVVASCYKEGRNLCDYHVVDQGKSVFCAAEICIALLKRLARFKESRLRIDKH